MSDKKSYVGIQLNEKELAALDRIVEKYQKENPEIRAGRTQVLRYLILFNDPEK